MKNDNTNTQTIDDVLLKERKKRAEREAAEERAWKVKEYKKIRDERNKEKFNARSYDFVNHNSNKEIKGYFKDSAPESVSDRRMNLLEMIDLIDQNNKFHDKKDQPMQMSKDWKKKLRNFGNKICDYMEQLGCTGALTDNIVNDNTFMQGFLNSQFKKSDGITDNKDETIEQYKELITQINLIETLAYDENIDYVSNVYTRKELEDTDEYIKSAEVNESKEPAKAFEPEDYKKVLDYIYEKNKGDFSKSPEAHIMAILGGEFGMRRATIEKLTVNDIDVARGIIKVPAEKNKSGVSYEAIPITGELPGFLQGIVKRAYEKNHNKRDENNEIKLITSRKSNQYKEFDRLLRNTGLEEKYKDNRFHALRRYFGQQAWNEYRETSCSDNKRKAEYIVNELLGHNKRELKNLDAYISNKW